MGTKIIFLAVATWYGGEHHGKIMANGETFDMNNPCTCATWLYPLGTELEVSYQGKTIYVLVTDRCDDKTEIDLSMAGFEMLTDLDKGRIKVEVSYVIPDEDSEL